MIETIDPESARYAADLLLLHGAWAGPGTWSRFTGAMAQRGWRCHLLDLGAAARAAGASDAGSGWVDGARKAIAGLGEPAIAIGHGAGALVALELATLPVVRAAIAVAPLAEGTRPLLPWSERWRLRILGGHLDPPGPDHAVFAGLPPEEAARTAASLVPAPASLLRWIDRAPSALGAPLVPTLVAAQESDPHARPVAVEVLARGLGADFEILPGGHWELAGRRIDAWATRLHRWIVRRAGADLLLLRGDEDLRDD